MLRAVVVCVALFAVGCGPSIDRPDGGPAPGTVGASCIAPGECGSGVCVAVGGGRGVCSQTCDDVDECPRGWGCAPPGVGAAPACVCNARREICDGDDDDCDARIDESCMDGVDAGGGCACFTGETQRENDPCPAGGARVRERTCVDGCNFGNWGAWGACTGAPECTAGATETDTQPCGTCGQQARERTCGADGRFGGWELRGECVDAPGCAAMFRSNTPNAQLRVIEAPSGVVLRSAHVRWDSLTTVYEHWYAEVENTGSAPVCRVRANARYLGDGGAVLTTIETYADAPLYRLGSVDTACIPPGQRGVFYSLREVTRGFDPLTARQLEVRITATAGGSAAPSPATPQVSMAEVVDVGGGRAFALRAQVRAARTIHAVSLDVFTFDRSGLVASRLSAIRPETLAGGATWTATTTSQRRTFDRYYAFTRFTDGAATFARALPDDDELARRAFLAQRDRVEAELADALVD